MDIKPESIEKILGPMATSEGEAIKVSLYIVSTKWPRLKKLDLSNLNPEERAAKLKKWAEGNRFVAVVEMGDRVFAYANAEFAEKLQKQHDLSLDGKRVAVTDLSEDAYKYLSTIGEAFEDYLLNTPQEEQFTAIVTKEKQTEEKDQNLPPIRQYLAGKRLLSDQLYMIDALIAKMENIPHKVILSCLQRMNEIQREIAERQREDEEEREMEKKRNSAPRDQKIYFEGRD